MDQVFWVLNLSIAVSNRDFPIISLPNRLKRAVMVTFSFIGGCGDANTGV
jgi:hypothetical protein